MESEKIRIFRNNDRFFPGIEYTFRIGRDVLNMEGLCDKISDRIGLSRGARYIFGLDGSRKYRLEELEDGGAYVASSDRKFVNLAYNKRRQRLSNRKKAAAKKRVRTGSPVVKLAGKRGDSSDSGNSTGSSNGKPSSREGRMIKIISNGEKPQEVKCW
ncbi:Echinoderm microtubule-associated protein-like [Armadillidium vulgare]|nr:Echinoderm microtubule-associated protein-like [Armadillidium vulgare]